MIRQIPPEHVKLGMFICGFGGSWFDHPFWRTRFVIASHDDLEKVHAADVPYVIIDESRGAKHEGAASDAAPAAARPPAIPAPAPRHCRRVPVPPPDRSGALAQSIARQRRRQVQQMVGQARQTMRGLFDDARMGRAVRVADTHQLVDDIAQAVANSPRTVLDIVRLKSKDEYTFAHSVAVCTLMINVATFLGLSEAETRDYGQAGLLHDLGKIGIPQDVLNKPDMLTREEFAVVRDHPEHGFRLLQASGDVCATALDVCRHHHERQDGNGYPLGLAAHQISRAAALGAICDCYDALTSDRIYKQAWSPPQALAAMWSWEGHFDRDLLFTFMQSIGVFPPGMVVRLRSNRLALVQPGRRQDTGPHVTAFFCTREREALPPQDMLLDDTNPLDSIVGHACPHEWGVPQWQQLRLRLWRGAVDALPA
ncbi:MULTISPECIES: HD-GYP domain-containing protein [unclassified Novosphingobium]|uniref:HD-GYP domain-containing protein n=1 Tax=Novosphingobium TaxID=165696 RepID=UPI00146BD36D|nr:MULTISPECIES: HD-GYP domain-containing protein [unclassified Novosphingobium]NKJ43076.1 HD-GYP domain-containing protein (c-di-GMP phosphodiesterase class II) [Novosphingobium sp. SG720]NMN07184.1 HD-GYP domain-containing protein (c-di-GMP phosphodiesterase class II) [Novosphingobium sp. SG919]NMN89228.1 HD-GYP domain-containing protein (c-di-GMP phosphodiesterase class II) [Novosphingobium sp. SG916]